jgi:hypothetical protein
MSPKKMKWAQKRRQTPKNKLPTFFLVKKIFGLENPVFYAGSVLHKPKSGFQTRQVPETAVGSAKGRNRKRETRGKCTISGPSRDRSHSPVRVHTHPHVCAWHVAKKTSTQKKLVQKKKY